MILEYIHANYKKEIVRLSTTLTTDTTWININSSQKLKFIRDFLSAYQSNQKIVLFDSKHKQLVNFYKNNDINKLDNIEQVNKNCKILFFTSGSTGLPIGAFKTKQNLEEEIKILKEILSNKQINRVVVTVPFVHIYGVLVGLLFPFSLNDITLIIKEDFLPYELLQEASIKNTLVITTPIFIKALLKLTKEVVLNSTLFISSTAPLQADDVTLFEDMYHTTLFQLFGSTETGGIAYKFGNSLTWKAIPSVCISTSDNRLCVSSPFISPFILNKKILPLVQPFQTEDIIKINQNEFILIGRSNKIIKISGKRISVKQLEDILESLADINKAVVEVTYKRGALKEEQLLIILEAKKKIDRKIIKKKIIESFGTLNIPFSLKYVDFITYSATGKKIIF